MSKATYETDEYVAVLTINGGENSLNFPFIDAFLAVLKRGHKNIALPIQS